ncbi:MAG: hypothetical protein J0H55_07030 [Chitinophagaceae bacterium]|nr:hypothetical protein [Chitinophagaceae bacterium]
MKAKQMFVLAKKIIFEYEDSGKQDKTGNSDCVGLLQCQTQMKIKIGFYLLPGL